MNDIWALIGIAALAIQTAYSSNLSYELKKLLWLTEDKHKTLEVLATLKFWKKFLQPYFSWLAFMPVLFFIIFYKISQLVNCPFCTAWHGGFWLGLFYWNQDIITSIMYGGICIVFVYFIEILNALKEKI